MSPGRRKDHGHGTRQERSPLLDYRSVVVQGIRRAATLRGTSLRVNTVLMDLVVRLTATLDEIWGADDRYDRYVGKTLEYVAAEFDKLTLDERQAFVRHVEAMRASAQADPLASDEFRRFLSGFASGFGLIDS